MIACFRSIQGVILLSLIILEAVFISETKSDYIVSKHENAKHISCPLNSYYNIQRMRDPITCQYVIGFSSRVNKFVVPIGTCILKCHFPVLSMP